MEPKIRWILFLLAFALVVWAVGPTVVLLAGFSFAILILAGLLSTLVLLHINKHGHWWADPIYAWWESLITMRPALFILNGLVLITGVVVLFGIPVTLMQFHLGWPGYLVGVLAMMPITILSGTIWATIMNRITGTVVTNGCATG